MPQESKSSPREIQSYLGRISDPLLDGDSLAMFAAYLVLARLTGISKIG
jgi:hypothetical protein